LTTAVIGGQLRLIEFTGAGCSTCGPANRRYAYGTAGQLLRSITLDAQGQPLSAELISHDRWGRLSQRSRQAYSQGKPVGAPRWLQRYEYTDLRFQDGSVAVGQQPTRITQPSVIAGKTRSTEFEYNDKSQVLRVTERGWSSVDDKGGQSPQGAALTRSTEYSYITINGRSVLSALDGPLPNGPKGDPSDSDVTRVQWDPRGERPLKLLHPAGLVTQAEYTPDGRTRRLIGMDGVVSEFEYAPSGALASIIRAGVTRRFEHDALGQAVGMLEATGARTRVTYDLSGQIAAMFDTQSNRIELARDREGRLLQARLLNPDGSVSQQRDYSAPTDSSMASAPHRDAVLSAMQQLVSHTEDSGGLVRPDLLQAMQVAQVSQPALAGAASALPPLAVTQETDINGAYTRYYRDDFGLLRLVQSPTTGSTVFEYDAAGRLIARVTEQISRAAYRRDPAGRVVAVRSRYLSEPDAPSSLDEDAQISWGPANKPRLIKYKAGEEQFSYDAAGRLTTHEQRVDGKRWTLQYSYNANGQLISRTLPDGQALAYHYRGSQHPRAGLLESVWLDGRIDRPLVYSLNDEADTYTQRRFLFGNGLSNERRLDAQGRVTLAGTPGVGQMQLGYAGSSNDGNASDGEPTSVKPLRSHGLGQLPQAATPPLWQARLHALLDRWRVGGDGALLPAYPASSAIGTALFDTEGRPRELFDDLGRQITRGDLRLSYDSLNRLVEVQRDTGATLQVVARYRYNLFGQRIAKVVTQAGSQTARTTYLLHDGNQLVAEADATGVVQRQYAWINDKPVAMLEAGRVLHVHTDHRNAPVALTDASRSVVWQAQLADYLAATPAQGQSLGSIAFHLRGSNQYFDAETGLHYNTHRYFDAQAGRYLTPDPLGLAVGPDLYAFALNRPHSLQDPLGLQPTPGKDWSEASFSDKLAETFKLAVTRFTDQLGADLKATLEEALADLPTTVAIFAAWQVISATPIGWIVNGLMAVYAAYSLGSEAIVLAKRLGSWVSQVSNATSQAQLCAAALGLATLMSELARNTAFARINPAKALRQMRAAAGGKKISETATPTQNAKKVRERLDRFSPNRCFDPFGEAYDKAPDKPKFEREFNDQLRRQQEALNRMSADEFLAARKAYEANKRNPDAAKSQAKYRAGYRKQLEDQVEKDLREQGFSGRELDEMKLAKVNSTMVNLAALHEPDMVAGGFFQPAPTCMGSKSVNCSIGAQWADKLAEMENYARGAVRDGHGGARLTFDLKTCPKK
ncbi:polymorphic toxin type 15 domain-containing protein, partial [Roseateles sp. LKC17W]